MIDGAEEIVDSTGSLACDAVIVIRARNDARNLPSLLTQVGAYGLPVFVAALDSSDDTVPVSIAHPRVQDVIVTSVSVGVGTATILTRFMNRTLVIIDGNITHLPVTVIPDLVYAASAGRLGKGKYLTSDPGQECIAVFAEATAVSLPPVEAQCLVSGLQSFPRGFAASIDLSQVPRDGSGDLAVSLLAAEAGWMFEEVPAGARCDDHDDVLREHPSRVRAHVMNTLHRAAQRRFMERVA